MSVTAWVTFLGKGRYDRSLYDNDEEWQADRKDEEEFLRSLEAMLQEQMNTPVRLVGTKVDGTIAGNGFDIENPPEDAQYIGRSDGLGSLQNGTLRYLLDGHLPEQWYNEDVFAPSRMMQDTAISVQAERYRHLIDHSPITGFYIPVDFPKPIWIRNESVDGNNETTIGSLQRLQHELGQWMEEFGETPEVPESILARVRNLQSIVDSALGYGLSIEIA